MHATSRHGTPSLASLPKGGGVSCFGRSSRRSVSDPTQPYLTSVKLMELAGPLDHSPRCMSRLAGTVSMLLKASSLYFKSSSGGSSSGSGLDNAILAQS